MGVQPFCHKDGSWASVLLFREGDDQPIIPVVLFRPLCLFLLKSVVGIGQQTMTDKVVLHDSGHCGRQPFRAIMPAEFPALVEMECVGRNGMCRLGLEGYGYRDQP